MKIRDVALIILSICSLIFISYGVSHALFSDTATSANNTFIAADTFPGVTTTVTPTVTPTMTLTPTPPQNIATHVVISEVQIDGGTGDASDNDFIELYNPTNSAINLGGYRLVKRTSASSTDDNIFTFTTSHVIPAHGFFLWAHKSGSNNYAGTIYADVFSSVTLAANNSIAIREGNLDTGAIIDALSWNSFLSSLKEGTEYSPDPGVNESLERKAYSASTALSMSSGGSDEFNGNGFDSNDNATDFILRSLSQPQNSSSPIEIP